MSLLKLPGGMSLGRYLWNRICNGYDKVDLGESLLLVSRGEPVADLYCVYDKLNNTRL